MNSAGIQTVSKGSLLTNFLIITGILLFGPSLLRILPARISSFFPEISIQMIYMWHFFSSWLLAHTGAYILICVGFIACLIVGFVLYRPSRKRVIALSLLLMLVLFYMLTPYQPAVRAAEGYSMIVPTAPNLFMRGLRNAQTVAELSSCEYELLGWEQETLFYQSKCEDGAVITWQISPDQMRRPIEFNGPIPASLQTDLLTRDETLAQVVAQNVYPVDKEPSVRFIAVTAPGHLSPSKRWVALISQHLYSTQDLLIIRQR